MPRRTEKKREPAKGGGICFIRGTYKGCTGWLDTANKSKKKSKMVWVVVNNEDYNEEVHTKVWQSLIWERHKVPKMWAETAFQQHPENEDALIKMA